MSVRQDAPAAGVHINQGFVQQHIGSATQHVGSGTSQPKRGRYDKGDEVKNSIMSLLGEDVSFPAVGSRDLDMHSSYPHAVRLRFTCAYFFFDLRFYVSRLLLIKIFF